MIEKPLVLASVLKEGFNPSFANGLNGTQNCFALDTPFYDWRWKVLKYTPSGQLLVKGFRMPLLCYLLHVLRNHHLLAQVQMVPPHLSFI